MGDTAIGDDARAQPERLVKPLLGGARGMRGIVGVVGGAARCDGVVAAICVNRVAV
jgi:hypothetical protein